MVHYSNLHGGLGVLEFFISDTAVRVKFKTSSNVYVYTYDYPGQRHVDRMKELAVAGRGLQTYINKNLRNLARNYEYIE